VVDKALDYRAMAKPRDACDVRASVGGADLLLVDFLAAAARTEPSWPRRPLPD
jgi:hypothetical protein